MPSCDEFVTYCRNFIFKIRDHQKNFLWVSCLWVGRRKVPILGYVPKNDEKNNSGSKGLNIMPNLFLLSIHFCPCISRPENKISPHQCLRAQSFTFYQKKYVKNQRIYGIIFCLNVFFFFKTCFISHDFIFKRLFHFLIFLYLKSYKVPQ